MHALVVGEALVDVVRRPGEPERAFAGGSAANVAVALSRLGRDTRLVTCFAEDEYGAILAEHLDGAGVALAGDPRTVERTSSAVAVIDADGAATYAFDLDWRPADPGEEVPVVVHTSSIGAVLPPGGDDVVALLERLRGRAIISYDINARPQVTGSGPDVVARVERLVALADVVKASDEDLEALWPGVGHAETARALAASGPAVVVVTRGAEGAHLVTAAGQEGVVAGRAHHLWPTPSEPATPSGRRSWNSLWERGMVGAAARATLLAMTPQDWQPTLTWAARAAAITVSRRGADPPVRADLSGAGTRRGRGR